MKKLYYNIYQELIGNNGNKNVKIGDYAKMCGIVGYLGNRQATEVLVEGLSKLEYRGYDSAGVAINIGEELSVRKFKGRL